MTIWHSVARWLGTVAVLGLCAWTAQADDTDPPGRAARISDAQGSVSLQPAGVTEWTPATLNRPLTTGDRVWSDASSRAELDTGAAVMRLGAMTGFSFLNLGDSATQLQLTAGTLIVRVRDLRAGENYEVDTPNIAVTLLQAGEYRFEVSESSDLTVVKVSEGSAQALAGPQPVQINAQQSATFSGTGAVTADINTLGAPDELDAWSAARERQLEDSPSREYVADDVAGTQDLDDNGQWQETPEYGYVWAPTVVFVGWAPYRYGHWAWIGPWGWTWIDDAPWGYAPFHYGRWVSLHNTWCWVPGPRIARPVYAPALVGWVAGPGGGSLTANGSSVGWFPLGPHEAYVPGYRASAAYTRSVNVTNTTIINNAYVTNIYTHPPASPRYVNNTSAAVTAVPQDVFASGQRLAGHTQRIPPALLTGALAGAAAPSIVPTRASVLGPNPTRGTVRPPPAIMNRPVLARTPLPRAPVPFDRQVGAIAANGGRPLGQQELAPLQPAAAAVPVRMVATSPQQRQGAAVGGVAGTGRGQPVNASPPLSASPAPAVRAPPRGEQIVAPTTAPRTSAQAARPPEASAPAGSSVPASGAYPQRPVPPAAYRPPASGVVAAPVQPTLPAPAREAAPLIQAPRPATSHPATPPAAPSAPKAAPQPAAHDLSSNR